MRVYYLRQHTEFGYLREKNVAVAQAREMERAKAEKIESAKTALSMGLSVDQVSKITGLFLEEVKKL